jgi:hypothetical protein
MRLERIRGATYQQLAEHFDISIATAWQIIKKNLWRDKAPAVCPHCKEEI